MTLSELKKVIKKDSPLKAFFNRHGERLVVPIDDRELYSVVNSELPNREVIEYLMDVANTVPINERLNVVFKGYVDLDKAVKVYKSYAAFELKETLRELKSLTLKTISFLIAGVFFLSLSYFLDGYAERVITDSVNIVGWFSIWESADTFVFRRQDKKKEAMTILKLYDAEWSAKALNDIEDSLY